MLEAVLGVARRGTTWCPGLSKGSCGLAQGTRPLVPDSGSVWVDVEGSPVPMCAQCVLTPEPHAGHFGWRSWHGGRGGAL